MSTRYADILTAISFAADRLSNQRRKDAESTPYINHLLQLATERPPMAYFLLPLSGDVSQTINP